MRYEGDKKDLTQYIGGIIPEMWIIRCDGKIFNMDIVTKPKGYKSKKTARKALIEAMGANFHHAYYWHKGKNNTFAKEGSKVGLGGFIIDNEKVKINKLAEEFTDNLLADGTFKLEKIT